jgi:hypothetical protein
MRYVRVLTVGFELNNGLASKLNISPHLCRLCILILSHIHCTFPDPKQDLGLILSPLESTHFPGQSLLLSCTANDPANFTWTFDDGPLPRNVRVVAKDSGPASSVLALTQVTEENSGAYTCLASSTSRGITNEDTSYLSIMST